MATARSGASETLADLDHLLTRCGDGELVGRMPHADSDPTLESIRQHINSVLDQTETAFREILGGDRATHLDHVAGNERRVAPQA